MRRRTYLILIVLIAVGTAGAARAADVKVEPAITVSEEYNDNVLLHPQNRVPDYITRIVPSVRFTYIAPMWDWDIAYAYEYRYYAREAAYEAPTQRLSLLSRTRIIQDFFFLDIKDEFSTVSLFSTRDYTVVSPYATQYLTKQNIFTVNPYLVFRPTPRTELTTGYEYRNVWYDDPVAIDKSVHAGYGDLAHLLSERVTLLVSGRYEMTYTNVQDFSHLTFLIGPRVEYQDRSYGWLRIGASKFSGYDADKATRVIWDAGILYSAQSLSIRYETGRRWIDDPLRIIRREDRYILAVSREVERTSLGGSVAYREYGNGGYSDERRYTTMVSFSHFLTERIQGLYAVTNDRYERFPVISPNTTTIVYFTDIRANYIANETLTYSLSYRYTDSYSPDVYIDNYNNNRIMIEVKKIF